MIEKLLLCATSIPTNHKNSNIYRCLYNVTEVIVKLTECYIRLGLAWYNSVATQRCICNIKVYPESTSKIWCPGG